MKIANSTRTVIPAEAGIQCLVSSRTKEKAKTLDSRLKMSGMTDWREASPLSFLGVQAASLHERFLPC